MMPPGLKRAARSAFFSRLDAANGARRASRATRAASDSSSSSCRTWLRSSRRGPAAARVLTACRDQVIREAEARLEDMDVPAFSQSPSAATAAACPASPSSPPSSSHPHRRRPPPHRRLQPQGRYRQDYHRRERRGRGAARGKRVSLSTPTRRQRRRLALGLRCDRSLYHVLVMEPFPTEAAIPIAPAPRRARLQRDPRRSRALPRRPPRSRPRAARAARQRRRSTTWSSSTATPSLSLLNQRHRLRRFDPRARRVATTSRSSASAR